jgi:hypothetical protein
MKAVEQVLGGVQIAISHLLILQQLNSDISSGAISEADVSAEFPRLTYKLETDSPGRRSFAHSSFA